MFRYYCCRKWEEALNRPRFRCSCVVTGGIIVIMPWFRILIDVPPHFPGRATHPCCMPTEEEVEHQNNSDSRLLFSFFSWPLTHNNNHCHRCITILVSVCFHPLGTIMTSLNQRGVPSGRRWSTGAYELNDGARIVIFGVFLEWTRSSARLHVRMNQMVNMVQ